MIKTSLKNKNYLSSGNLFLDKIVGGLSLGTVVLLIEDNPSQIYESFIKYFIAEGLVNEQKVFFYHSDPMAIPNIINNLPYKSTQVESILNAKKVNDPKSSEMKIAWRYENIKYSNILEDIMKSTDYIFDLSRHLQDMYITEKNKNLLVSKTLKGESSLEILDEVNRHITKDYQEFSANLAEDEIKFTRFVVPNLFANDSQINMSASDLERIKKELKLKLITLRNLVRSINGIVYITVNKAFLNKDIYNLVDYFSDYVFTLQSFMLDPQKLEDYDALFIVNKLPRICTLKNVEMETDTYGVMVEKRKVIIEKIDIGVEIDRNTKVKEKDITPSQAICGQEKYSKDFEF